MVSPFQTRSSQVKEQKRMPNGSPFQQRATEQDIPQEPWYKSLARTAYQIPSGVAQAVTYPMDIFNILATGGALDEEGIQELERAAERSGVPFDRDEYIKAVMQQSQNIPTQSNVERMVEESTGLPLTAQTPLQKGLKFASSGAGFTPGTLSQKVVGGAASEGLKEGLEYVGVPEPLAELAALPGGVALGSKAPAITASKVTKPSGLTTRKFEEVKSPSKVSESKISKINEKVESEFKGIADKIFEESPIYDVQSALKEGPLYKESVVEEFKKVQSLADDLSESISSKDITKRLSEKVSPKRQKGFMDSESDKAYKKVIQDLIKETPAEDVPISPGKLVEQYRKNNEELGKLFEPGQSKAYNSGKEEAYLDYNKAIAETIEGVYPNSEFSKLFKDSNKKWSQIKDAEAISEYMDKLFEGGKINFKEAQKAFDSKRLSHSLERSLGKKGHAEFKQLVNDLSSIKDPLSNLRGLPEKSFEDYAKSMFPFILSKTYGTAKFAFNTLTGAKKQLWEFMLDKPKYRLEWKSGVDALKKGDPIKAKRIFDDLTQSIEKDSPEVIEKFTSKEQAVKDYNMSKKPNP